MTLQAESRELGAPTERRVPGTRHAYRAGFVVALASVLFSVVLLPFAVASLVAAVRNPVGSRAYDVSGAVRSGEWTKLNIAAVALDEAAGTVTLRVSGFHNCPGGCADAERVELFSVHADPSGALGPPPATSVDLPSTSAEVDQDVTLPVSGDLIDYPFDRYTLLLGTAFSRVSPSGALTAVAPAAAHAGLALSVDDDLPRLSLDLPRSLDPARFARPGAAYESVTSLTFYRPAYLRVLAVLLTLLVVLAAAYGVLLRPFAQIIPTVGGLVLGVWGVRSLLVGSYPPDSTGVDLVLEAAILLLLLALGIRALQYMWPRTGFERNREGPGRPGGDTA